MAISRNSMAFAGAASPEFASSPLPLLNSNTKNHKQIWRGIMLGFSTVLVLAFLCFSFKKCLFPILARRRNRNGILNDGEITLRRFQLEELEKATNNFSEECLLGSGGFGNVYRGNFHAQGRVAIKRPHSSSYQNIEEFRNEVKLLANIKHRNLVGLVGYCQASGAKGAKILVYEYVPNGSLLEYIMGRGRGSLTWRQRVNIAIGAAKGIAHLHEGIQPSIIHRDIKPSNILVGEGFEAKVSDFGLVKSGPIGDQSHVSSQIKGTPGYLDPAYCSSFHLSPFSDVFSFGVILLQLVAARPAVDATRSHPRNHIIEWARPSIERGNIEEILDANLLSDQCNMKMMLKMGELGLRCVVKVPKERPTMTQVWQELEEALCSLDNIKLPSRGFPRSTERGADNEPPESMDHDYSQSFVSIDGVGFQRFRVEMDTVSFQSTTLRCLENNSISMDMDQNNWRKIMEATIRKEDIG